MLDFNESLILVRAERLELTRDFSLWNLNPLAHICIKDLAGLEQPQNSLSCLRVASSCLT